MSTRKEVKQDGGAVAVSGEEVEVVAPMSEAETVAALKKQVGFYFSRENLATDTWLVSQMEDQMYVKVDVVASFRKVRSLTSERELLLQAMRESEAVELSSDERLVKPAFELKRNTIILREISPEVTAEEVRGIFDDDAAGTVTHLHAETVSDTVYWYVRFEDEETTRDTHMWLTSQKLKGKPIRARIKTESLLTGGKAPGSPGGPGMAPPGAGGFTGGVPPGAMYGGGYYMPPHYMPVAQSGSYGYPPHGAPHPYVGYANPAPYAHSGTDQSHGGRRGGAGRGESGSRAKTSLIKEFDGARGGRGGDGAGGRGRRDGRSLDQKRGGDKSRRGGRGGRGGDNTKGGRGGNGKGGKGGRKAPDFELGLQSFPPLPSAKGSAPKPTGYNSEFVQYSRDDLVTMIKSFAEAVVYQPPELAASDAPVVQSEPNTFLEVEKPVPEIRRRKKGGRNKRRDNHGGRNRGKQRSSSLSNKQQQQQQKHSGQGKEDTTTAAAGQADKAAGKASNNDGSSAGKKAETPKAAAEASETDSGAAAGAPPASGSAAGGASGGAAGSAAGGAAGGGSEDGSKPTYADLFKNK